MDKILEVKKLKIAFRTSSGILKAVRDISFDLERGKTLAIVGESGSGKSVTSKAIIGILAGNSIIEGGEILYDGKDLLRIPEDEMHRIRGDKISMIFQDPLSSLNPIVKIGKQITEAMLLKNKTNRREARRDFKHMLDLVSSYMVQATGDKAKVDSLVNTFKSACEKGSRREQGYNADMTTASDLLSDVEDLLFNISKKQKVDLRSALTGAARRLGKIRNEYVIDGKNDQLRRIAAELASAANACAGKSAEDIASIQAATEALSSLKSLLQEITTGVRPDFLTLGYSLMKGVQAQNGSVKQMNDILTERMNREFMNEFVDAIAKGIEKSYNDAAAEKRQVLTDLEKAVVYYSSSFKKREGLEYAKKLTEKVEKSIDRTELTKDSAAYAFGVSLHNAVESFFDTQVYNAKEEKRFSRQTRKHDALIARGKHVEWKVIPKNVYTIEDLRDNILVVINRVMSRYETYLSTPVDFHARAQEMMKYLQEKESNAVYRLTKGMAKEKAIKLMEEVGIHEPRTRYYQYPFEFSGGMRQRIVIAIALAADPDILICDEPTTALDVTIQAQILELINRLKKERNLSVIFITHDLGVVANMADDIAVMYAGKIIEYGTADDVFYDPRHPYTWALLSSMPDLDTTEKLDAIPGTPPNMIYPPVGDAFADRNKYAMQIDFEQQPPMFRVSNTHSAATWLLHPDAPKVEMPRIIKERIARMKKSGGDEHAKA